LPLAIVARLNDATQPLLKMLGSGFSYGPGEQPYTMTDTASSASPAPFLSLHGIVADEVEVEVYSQTGAIWDL